MSDRTARIRLFVDGPLGSSVRVTLKPPQVHYLNSVMRCQPGDLIEVFNGADGCWSATIVREGKKGISLECQTRTAPQRTPPDLWLVFAPLKKSRTDYVVEKATELGVRQIFPVRTELTNASRVSGPRLRMHAIAAAQQCGENHVPVVAELQSLDSILGAWPVDRQLLFCDEARAGVPVTDLKRYEAGKWAILIGPVGGFTRSETTRIEGMSQSVPVSLGPRLLRADTAAVAAITLWQFSLGDWNDTRASSQ